MPEPVEIAYAAGLFEGEGTVRTDKYYYANGNGRRLRKTPQFKLRIQMTDKEPLMRMFNIFGGHIYGPYHRGKAHYKIHWVWDLDSPPLVRDAISAMWPYLSPRRQLQLEVFHSLRK